MYQRKKKDTQNDKNHDVTPNEEEEEEEEEEKEEECFCGQLHHTRRDGRDIMLRQQFNSTQIISVEDANLCSILLTGSNSFQLWPGQVADEWFRRWVENNCSR